MTEDGNNGTDDNLLSELEIEYMNEIYIGLEAYLYLSYVFMAFGIVGNVLCLLVLHFRDNFQTTHFSWYKAIAWADFAYCVNMIAEKIVQAAFMEKGLFYNSYHAACYLGYVGGFIASGSTYLVVYLTVLVTAERFAATCLPTFYMRYIKNMKLRTANLVLVLCAVLAFGLNSWSAMTGVEVAEWMFHDQLLYLHMPANLSGALQMANQVKDVYNFAVNCAHIITLCCLTLATYCARPKLPRLLHRTRSRERRTRERALNCLMAVVVGLQLTRIAFLETRRVVQFMYPSVKFEANLQTGEDANDSITSLNVLYYGNQWLALLGNLVNLFDRTCKCYVYLLSRRFRRGLVSLFSFDRGTSKRSSV